jgi:uncharacterized protein YjbI with pentapeptide repeats
MYSVDSETGRILPREVGLSELPQILKEHELWLRSGGKEGKRAALTGRLGANNALKGANLERAVLNYAEFAASDLTDTNFQRAELRRVNFQGAPLRGTNFREADLQNANLEEASSLLSAQLVGADVAGAKLPQAIAEFQGLKTIAEATSNAQKLFIAILGGCLYSWLTIGTTKDAALLTNSASSPLPIIGTALPIVGFYLVAPVVLLALYFYFHLNMQRLWEALADLPAVFPDGRPLDKMADPWLLNGLVRAHFFRLRNERPPLSRMQQWLSILLAWWVVPATLFVFWGRYLSRHDALGTFLHVGLLASSIGGGWMFYRLARATLRGAPRKPFVWTRAWKDGRAYKRIAGVFGACVLGVIFYLMSVDAIEVDQRYYGRSGLWRLVTPVLQEIGFRPFANIAREDVSTKPSNWTGDVKEYPLVKGAHLPLANMQHAYAELTFLVNADMRGANLSNAYLSGANLARADLSLAEMPWADLPAANLSGANLSRTNLSYANLTDADLSGANLSHVNLSKANLLRANLSRANLSDATLDADFSKANLSEANLSNACLWNANLSDANLSHAHLSSANFPPRPLSNATLSNTKLDEAYLEGVDLRGTKGLTKSQLEKAKIDEHTLLPADLPP